MDITPRMTTRIINTITTHPTDFTVRSFSMKYLHFLNVISVCAGVALSGASLTAHAQQGASMPAMNMSGSNSGESNPSTQAFKEGSDQMMKNMSAPPYTGDTDKDFVAHMIPHHQGAVSMAKVELKYGKDPAMKRLARNIIKAQNEEIAYMKSWQAKHGK
ncbi:uncharacterized protein (DUF305 family) [Paraburkholderia fungorum]|jgi:uncharacterized protein (DUF305 family)|uniref:Uncharacterized protein (DUF305 family) n=2 Tax=Burkholderiaceae TaxID=119060 RepID=A0AAW3V0K3_9BURK|nr:uncharacterized protein (DUF305 family) [Paraburkholderia fungorum]MBB6203466.1 uncharacterized protein (DUF305 family) [Paraburkholderia fungorum]